MEVIFLEKKAFLKLSVMARCKKRKATAATALGSSVLVSVRIEIDFLLQSVAKVRVSAHRVGSNLCAGSPGRSVSGKDLRWCFPAQVAL